MTFEQSLVLFLMSALVIAVAGVKISRKADILADRTGMGEALMGGVFLGASTSISGSVLSMTSAFNNQVDLAVSNAIGGIAVQTFFLCVADITYRKGNLEHAAASSTNLMQTALMIAMMSFPLAVPEPAFTFLGVHPLSLILILFYLWGLKYTMAEKQEPMWKPKVTIETVIDKPDSEELGKSLGRMWLEFATLAGLMALASFTTRASGLALAEFWGLSHFALGVLLTAVATSLPELITTLAAVRRKALTLAVSGIVGGNTFDVLFLSFSDMFYREGSLYHAMTPNHHKFIGLVILMHAILLLGLIRRERQGPAGIGVESFFNILIYVGGLFLIL